MVVSFYSIKSYMNQTKWICQILTSKLIQKRLKGLKIIYQQVLGQIFLAGGIQILMMYKQLNW